MAWTYSDSPGAVPRDAVRLLIGDTDSADPQPVSDAEIAYFLAQRNDSAAWAAVDAARKLAAFYSRQADTTTGKTSVSKSQRATQFRDLASQLEQQAQREASTPIAVWAGGISLSESAAIRNDPNAIQPAFSVGMDDMYSRNGD